MRKKKPESHEKVELNNSSEVLVKILQNKI
jgi:hypothetical protein